MTAAPNRPVGKILSPQDYFDDFYPRFWSIDDQNFWKLERIQSFQEQGSESFDAFIRGDWDEAMRLINTRRDSLAEYYQKIADHGFITYRVRVVESDITPYLQWQLQSLRQRHELGEHIRIVTEADIAPYEHNDTMPEIVTVGGNCFYEVLYDNDGAITGAIRSENSEQLIQWQTLIKNLYSVGEDIDIFLDRTMKNPKSTTKL